MLAELTACEAEEDELKAEYIDLIDRYDQLFEMGMQGCLGSYDARELDQLYTYLYTKERVLWAETPKGVVQQINDKLGVDFPLLRYDIGLLPPPV